MAFWWAIGATVAVVFLLVTAYLAYVLVSSKRLQDQQRFSANILESSPALIIILDQNNRVMEFNRSCQQHSDYLSVEVIGKHVEDLPFLSELFTENLIIVEREGATTVRRFTDVLTAKSGRTYLIEWQIKQLKKSNGKVLKIASGMDISALKAAQQEALESRQQLLEYQKQLREMAEIAEAKERRRIAEELHDRIGQTLALANMGISDLLDQEACGAQHEKITELHQTIGEILNDIRSLIFEISPPVLYDHGLAPAIDSLIHQLRKRNKITIKMNDDGAEKPLDQHITLFIFKAARELLVNALKHSKATEIRVFLRRKSDRFQLEITDNGIGFDPEKMFGNEISSQGFGLSNIKTRAEYYHGSFRVYSAISEGSRFILEAPLHFDSEGAT